MTKTLIREEKSNILPLCLLPCEMALPPQEFCSLVCLAPWTPPPALPPSAVWWGERSAVTSSPWSSESDSRALCAGHLPAGSQHSHVCLDAWSLFWDSTPSLNLTFIDFGSSLAQCVGVLTSFDSPSSFSSSSFTGNQWDGEIGREKEKGKSQWNTWRLRELKQLIRSRSKATSFSHCLVLVSSRLCLSPLLLKHTQGSSLALIKANIKAPPLPINQSVEHKKGKINERCVVTENWSWSPNGVWIGWPYYDLWLKYWIYVIYGFYTPMADRSHLSFSPPNCPGKTKFYTWSKWECKIQQNRQETGLRGGFRFKVKNIILMWNKS